MVWTLLRMLCSSLLKTERTELHNLLLFMEQPMATIWHFCDSGPRSPVIRHRTLSQQSSTAWPTTHCISFWFNPLIPEETTTTKRTFLWFACCSHEKTDGRVCGVAHPGVGWQPPAFHWVKQLSWGYWELIVETSTSRGGVCSGVSTWILTCTSKMVS